MRIAKVAVLVAAAAIVGSNSVAVAAPKDYCAELKGGISMDQVLANHIGRESVQPCMVLGCEQPVTGYHETNFSLAYSSHISWQSATSPVPLEEYPAGSAGPSARPVR